MEFMRRYHLRKQERYDEFAHRDFVAGWIFVAMILITVSGCGSGNGSGSGSGGQDSSDPAAVNGAASSSEAGVEAAVS